MLNARILDNQNSHFLLQYLITVLPLTFDDVSMKQYFAVHWM